MARSLVHGAGQAPAVEGPRDPAVARAEADLEESRERVAESMTALRREVARRTDWRQWIRRQPLAAVGAALLVGFLIGRRGGGRARANATGGRSWR